MPTFLQREALLIYFFLLLLVSNYVDYGWQFTRPIETDPDVNLQPGIDVGLFREAVVQVDTTFFSGYELTLSAPAPLLEPNATHMLSGPLYVLGNDDGKDPFACGPIDHENGEEFLANKTVLVRRGRCSFLDKIRFCEDSGAVSVIISGEQVATAIESENPFDVDVDDIKITEVIGENPEYSKSQKLVSKNGSNEDEDESGVPEIKSFGAGIPGIIVSPVDFTDLCAAAAEGEIATVWSLPNAAPGGLIQLILLLVYRSFVIFVVAIVFVGTMARDHDAPKRASPLVVEALPVRPWNGEVNRFEQSQCSICLDDFEPDAPITTLPCDHEFHEKCVSDWLLECGLCPLCKTEIDEASVGLEP